MASGLSDVRLLRIPLAGLALAGFLLSLWVHICALRGIDVSRAYPQVWGLHAGIFVVFFPMVLASRRVLGRKPSLRQWRELLPGSIGLLCAAVILYSFVNFFVGMQQVRGESPAVVDGQYVLQSHGHTLSTITAEQYEAAKASELRMFSGHWLVFYFVPFAFFAFGVTPRSGAGPVSGGNRP